MKKFLCLLPFLVLSFTLLAQKGLIKGKITDRETSEEIIGGNVVIEGTTTGASTDLEGNFQFSVDAGTYNIAVSYIGYANFKFTGLVVNADEIVELNIHLVTDDMQLEEIVIEAKADISSEHVLLMDRKKSIGLTQAIGAAELSKVLAGSAAEGLKKVVGLSIQGSKFVIVRGLSDRYNSSALNGFPVASPNPDKRILPYDIFPDDVIDNLSVKKSFTPDVYGDFSGASINVKTKDYTDEQTLLIDMGVSMNTQSTFKDFLFDQSSKSDKFGYNQTRVLPSVIGEHDATYQNQLESGVPPNQRIPRLFNTSLYVPIGQEDWFQTQYAPEERQAPVNKNMSITYGNFFPVYKLNQDAGIGLMLNANYSDGTELQTGKIRMLQNNQGALRQDFDANRYIQYTNVSGLANLTLKFNRNNSVVFNSMYSHITNNNPLVTEGDFWDFDDKLLSQRVTYKDYELFSTQLDGNHAFAKEKLSFNWGISRSNAAHTEPDRRQVSWRYDGELPEAERKYFMNAQDASENHNLFVDMDDLDNAAHAKLSYVLIPSLLDDAPFQTMSITGGFDYRYKTRNYQMRQFNNILPFVNFWEQDPAKIDDYLNVDNINNGTYQNKEGTQNEWTYNAELAIQAPYFDFQWQVIPSKLNINLGARYEMSAQFIEYAYFDPQIEDPSNNPPEKKEINTNDLFPSILLRYDIKENLILKGSYSKTVSRPDFRELAPVEYRQSYGDFRWTGNPELQNGYNNNFDLRLDHYSKYGGLISIGAFSKKLDNPIVQNVKAGSNPIRSYQNGQHAEVYGLEFEYRDRLEFISPALRDFTLNANFTWLRSQITIDTDSISGGSTNQTSNVRKLEGASPYLVNVDLTYDKFFSNMSWSWTVAYNVFGRRLSGIGFLGTGDAYELSYGTLNFSTGVDFGSEARWGIKLSAGNLLNPAIRTQQETLNVDGSVNQEIELNNYKRGMNFGMSVHWNIL